ncbi:hypothetical protein JCM3774_003194 [Rhodotorula dairenensis]
MYTHVTNMRQPGPPPILHAGGATWNRHQSSRTATPLSVPIPNGGGPGDRYQPGPSTVAADSFHGSGAQPAPPTPYGNHGSYHTGRNNSQLGAGRGYPDRDGTVLSLKDDHNLPTEHMFQLPAAPAEDGFRCREMVDDLRIIREKVHMRRQTGRADPPAPPTESPSKTRREEEMQRKLELERQTRPEADDAAEEKRRQERDLRDQLRQARSAGHVASHTTIRRPGDVFDKIGKIAKRTSPVTADAQTTAKLKTRPTGDEVRKKQKRQTQIDVSDESDDGKKRRSSQPRGEAPRDPKGKGKQREAKASRLGAARRDGFADGDAGPSRLEGKGKNSTSCGGQSPRKSSKRRQQQPVLDEWLAKKKEAPVEKATPLLDLFHEEQNPSDGGSVTLSDSSDDEMISERLRRARADSRFDSPYPEFDPTQAPADPDTLCPFCDQPLPDAPSADLLRKRDALINDPSARYKSTIRNSKAVRLRDGHVVRTAEFCKQHRDERIFIPQGRAQGWPAEIDWEALPARIEKLLRTYLNNVVLGKVASPFLENALSDFSRIGGKRGNAVNDLATFGVEEPGYYGPKGRRVICDAVTQLMTVTYPLLTPHRVAPLDVDFYVRRVLLPECAIELVRDDLGGAATVSRTRAALVVQESRGYGKAMFLDVCEGEERGMTQAPVDVDDSATSSESEIEVEVTASQSRGASPTKKRKASRTPCSSSSQSPRRPSKRKPLHRARDDASDSDEDDTDDEEAATLSKVKVRSAVASTSKGGLRLPKSFLSSGVVGGGKPSSSGSSATVAASSRSSKVPYSTALTVPESDVSEEEDDSLRPPPSAQARPAKSTAYSAGGESFPTAAASSLFAEMPTSSAAGLSDAGSSASGHDSSDDDALELVETGFSARKPAKKRGRTGRPGRKKMHSPSPLTKRQPDTAAAAAAHKKRPRKADKARSPKKRKE